MNAIVNLLLVDDQPENLGVLESLLTRPDYRLTMVTSADDALLALLDTEFALIVLDVEMPGMNGIELARVIKQRKKTSAVPIIFVTAHRDDERHIMSGYAAGGVDYVTKPLNPVVLQSKVAVFAELHQKNRELQTMNDALQQEMSARERGEIHAVELEREIEQRKEAERAAEAANRTKDEFLALLGHELRNPLAPIVTALHLIKGEEDVPFTMELGVIERQVEHLTRLVDDLLDVARIAQGKLQLRKEDLELSTIVAKAVELASPLIEIGRHQLTVAVPSENMRLHVDGVRMTQVISNLLTNAARYTPPDGSIALTAWREGTEIVISVKDSGVGIGPELRPVLFDLFAQGRQGVGRSKGGLGIGLALVRNLVQCHDGTVTALSDGPDQGSEFVVRIPALQDRQPEPPPAAVRPARRSAKQPRRILLVDDNTEAAELLALVLRRAGHSVMVANDGPTALETLAQFSPEVALLDIGLPVMDGYELASQLRARLGAACPRIMAMTGYGQESDRSRSAYASFEHHFVKPLRIDALLDAIDAPPGAQLGALSTTQ